jgi:hypothetical protein
MTDSSLPHPWMTRHAGAGSLPGAQLGLSRPQGHVNSESIISLPA